MKFYHKKNTKNTKTLKLGQIMGNPGHPWEIRDIPGKSGTSLGNPGHPRDINHALDKKITNYYILYCTSILSHN